ncbi:non-ribosomal peptide synthetase, partial [Niastella populi]|uniref:non-ribosomal peptide synthetase n=1 Tax=Niastella populi TaxID=550983 RepID=UPI001056AE5E
MLNSNLSSEYVVSLYFKILDFILKDQSRLVKEVEYLNEAEKHKLLFTFNDTEAAYPGDKTVVDLFIEQAGKYPDNLAVSLEGARLTYQELDELSNQLAHYLKGNYDIRPNDLVGIKLERTEWMLVSIMGVLKSGGAYVTIEPGYPQERIDFIEKDTNYKVCIDEEELKSFKENIDAYTKERIDVKIQSNALAYVIYTSGSTGSPKGVMVEHSGLVNMAYDHIRNLKLSSSDNILQFVSFSFDGSVIDIFMAFLSGATLVVVDRKIVNEKSEFLSFISRQQVTVMTLSPAYLRALNKPALNHVRLIINAGEAAYVPDAIYYAGKIDFFNCYGPTEGTVHSTLYKVNPLFEYNSIPIGRPTDNKQIFILNDDLQLQPIGITGEICISGTGLARGYLNQEELTKKKFVANPFKEGERLYKTGDLGRWLPDGNIEFVGRKDNQVKIRGYRIELGEIEHALVAHEEIKQAVVLANENESGERELVAYVTVRSNQNTDDLRSYLKDTLPSYMLPACFVQLEAMPLTANGKIDRKSLPKAEGPGSTSGVEYVAPGTEQEKLLTSVWSDVFKRPGIGIRDNFFNLGGDSIKSILVVARLNQYGYRLKVEHLLKTPVLEELARLMELTNQLTDQNEVSGEVVLTPIQEWFFKAEEIKAHDHFNQSVLLYSKEQLDSNILEKSIADLTRHHDALRMVYKQREGAWQQFNEDTRSKRYTIDFYDLREADNGLDRMMRLGEELQAGIRLSEGPLFRVAHFRLQDGDRLGLIVHHLVVDGVSWRILLEDLSTLYSGYKEGKKTGLPLKTDSFQRWALLQKEYALSKKLAKERDYWQKVCLQEVPKLPHNKAVKEGQTAVIDSAEFFGLDKTITGLLQTRVHGVYNTEINDVLLTGLGLALKEVLSVGKSVLQIEGHGREEIIEGVDISRTVGWFT